MAMLTTWMRSTIGTYVDNPTSKRDYRAQLRGSRSIILWTVYLIALIGIGMLNYSSTVSRGEVSIVEAQRSLQDFYQITIILLASMIVLISPALAATAIVVEKERRSLDLIFSAPVKPKTLLVGKMISAYRYTWMLLVLSLPVTAVCVVLGGATWGEVLAAYALLSFHALLFSAIALLLSSLANKPVGALIWTYLAVGIYSVMTGYLAATFDFRATIMGTSSNEAPFVSTLSPFLAMQSAGTHTTLFGVPVPNWILFGLFSLFVTRFLLLGAASALSPYNSWETKNLRLTSVVSMLLLGLLIGYLYVSPYAAGPFGFGGRGAFGGGSMGGAGVDILSANVLAVLSMLLLVPLPFLCCSGLDGERKFWPNGVFRIKEILRGTPAGGLPFLLLCFGAAAAGVFLATELVLVTTTYDTFTATLVWGVGFWVFCWSLGRFASSVTLELKSARTIHLAFLIVALGLPIPFLAIIDSEQSSGIWKLYPMYPLWADSTETTYLRYAMGIGLLLIGCIIAFASNRKLKAKLAASPEMA